MKRVPFPVLLALALLVALAGPAFAWKFGAVDSENDDSAGTSLSISTSGTVYVAWEKDGGDDLWRAHWTGSAWVKEQVGGIGFYSSCYGDTGSGDWVDYGPSGGFRPDDGKAGIASVCTVDLGEGTHAVHWTYYSSSQQKWVTDNVGGGLPGGGTNVDLAYDPDTGNPSIVVGDRRDGDVTWIHKEGSNWAQDIVQSGEGGFGVRGPLVSIAFSPVTGEPAVAWLYREDIPSSLSYATYDSTTGAWTESSSGLPSDAIGVPSLAVARGGTPSIAFQQGSSSASHLEVATLSGSTWTLSSVDSSSAVAGVSPSLAFKGSLARVASYDQTNGNLRWATSNGTSWSNSTLESTNNVGQFPSLAFNSTGSSYISYWDKTKKDVRWSRPS